MTSPGWHPSAAEVDSVLDRERSPAEAATLLAHVAECERCRGRFAALVLADGLFAAIPLRPAAWRSRHLAAVLALAAVAALAVVLGTSGTRDGDARPGVAEAPAILPTREPHTAVHLHVATRSVTTSTHHQVLETRLDGHGRLQRRRTAMLFPEPNPPLRPGDRR